MSRNQNSLFSTLPSVDIKRSKFKRPQSIKFTGNVGVLIPFYVDEVLPGDTHQIRTSKVVRLQTPITPFMDQLYLDTYYFFVPNRLVWDHWKEFNGENTTAPWIQPISYSVPQLRTVSGQTDVPVLAGSALDYMGIPIGVGKLSFNALPLRMYYLIWNEWFRDQNLQYPVNIDKSDTSYSIFAVNNQVYTGQNAMSSYTGFTCAVNKFHDYFSSALPSPQKGPDVTLNMVGNVPVVGTGDPIGISDGINTGKIGIDFTANLVANPDIAGSPLSGAAYINDAASGLSADLSGISVATINQLRTAFQIQKLFEADARGGSRYTEILRQHFSVVSPDARLQRPEYLGGNRIPINVNQVIQTSETGTTPQGTTAAYSLTVDSHGEFIHSFTEHGFIIGVCCVRYPHTYQQGLERFWSRQTRFDYYWPVFAHLGEQAILNKEIYAQGSSVVDAQGNIIDDQVFGYQEAWSDYRYKPSRVAGEMRSAYQASLDVWHLGDDYSSLPSLSAGWIAEDKSIVDRVLQVTSSVSNQLLFDMYVENDTTRPMPLHSVPGLVDHF